MPFRLVYLGVTNALALLRLLPMSDRDKDAAILALRHQIVVLQRQLHGEKVRFTHADRALLAALLHRLLRGVRLLVRPDTLLRWHRDLIASRHARISRPKRVGRPRTIRSIRRLGPRLAGENSIWGYRRILYVLTVIEHATRRGPRPGRYRPPDRGVGGPDSRNLLMDLNDTGLTVKYLIRDRDGKYPALFDTILADAESPSC